MLFKERSKIAMEILAKQPPVTLEMARAQAKALKERSVAIVKKGDSGCYSKSGLT